MANSLELRVPLLDHQLVEMAFSLLQKYTKGFLPWRGGTAEKLLALCVFNLWMKEIHCAN
jgi:hypothetical protein